MRDSDKLLAIIASDEELYLHFIARYTNNLASIKGSKARLEILKRLA